jgi:hypothetical protein
MELTATLKAMNTALLKIDQEMPAALRAAMMGSKPPPGMAVPFNLIALIKERIQRTGTNAEGQKFKPYSTKPMLIGRTSEPGTSVAKTVYKVLAGNKGNRKKYSWVTVNGHKLFVLPGGYAQAKGIYAPGQKGIVDFTVSGAMMRSIKVKSVQGSKDHYEITISPSSAKEKKKLEGNEDKRGEILEASQKELERVERAIVGWYEKRLQEIFDK